MASVSGQCISCRWANNRRVNGFLLDASNASRTPVAIPGVSSAAGKLRFLMTKKRKYQEAP